APLAQSHHDGKQALALGGQDVLLISRAIRSVLCFENPRIDQLTQSVGENVSRHPQASLEIAETAHAIEGIAHDEKRPSIPDQIDGAGNRTKFVADGL